MKKLIIGNLKMNLLTIAERQQYLESFQQELKKLARGKTEIVLCPPFVHLEKFAQILKSEKVSMGGQNIFWEEKGSFTGEISATMLKSVGCSYVIVGHSERRKYFGENGEIINTKIKQALENDLVAIVCVGESKEEKENGQTSEIIAQQIKQSLMGINAGKVEKIVLAYEPIWSVGSDAIPTSDEILVVKIIIKKMLIEKYGTEVAGKVKIIYGGSVTANTATQVCIGPQMDGVLVGRESLVPSEFLKIASIINAIRNYE
ncbi:MAG: triose-phosphate isomerase [Candidatus Moraniibacteriota bacterium]